MAQIRQEINIEDALITRADSNGSTNGNAIIQLDTTQYNGTVTYYFEVNGSSQSTGTATAELVRVGTTTVDASVGIPAGLGRSSSFTPPAGQTEYFVRLTITLSTGSGGTSDIKTCRLVIIQNATPIASTETQIEIGNASSTTTTTDTALTNPKYWQYTSANWDGTITAYFEGTFKTGTSKSAATMTLQTSTSITAPSWSNVTNTAITTTSTAAARVRSTTAFTLTAGNWYRAVMKAGNSKSGITVYNAKIILDQNNIHTTQTGDLEYFYAIYGGSGTWEAQAGQITTDAGNFSLDSIDVGLKKTASPSDNLYVDIASSISGAALGTSDSVAASTVTTGGGYINFPFSTPVSLTGSTTYYVRVFRDGARDTTNFCATSGDASRPSSKHYKKDSGSWGSATNGVDSIRLHTTASPTLLEPQYLLANTLFTAGTNLQTFLTKW